MTHKATRFDFVMGFLRLIRINNVLILALTQYLTRILLIGPEHDWQRILSDPSLHLIVVATGLIAGAGYIINDYFDVKIDVLNKPERVVIGRYLKRRVAMGAHQLMSMLGVGLGLWVGKWIGLINVVTVTLLWFYSSHFKKLPLIGNVVVSALTGLSLMILTVEYPTNRHLVVIYAVFSFFISLVREIIKDMEDIRGDEANGCQTVPILWGVRYTKILLYVLISVFITTLFVLAGSIQNLTLAWLFMGLLAPIGYLVYRLVFADTRRHFTSLSRLCKWIMIAGLVTMLWA